MSAHKRKSAEGDDQDVSTQAKGNSASSYPRERVSIACEVCRLRKSRCDARKPARSLCADLGIECI
jgi:hypothetical protein